MANNFFNFKQFTITQINAAMKVGTDGVLLGAWADCSNASSILDIGAGTGLIAIMLAQRCEAIIDAIEIDSDAIIDAEINIKNTNWAKRITTYNCAIQQFHRLEKYDLIVSNPPYFSQSQKTQHLSRTMARHDDSMPTNDLFDSIIRLLKPDGKFCVIIPTDNYDNYINVATLNKLNCSKKLWLKPTPTKSAKRILLEFTFMAKNCLENELVIEDKGRHQYSDAYKELCKEYYLNF